MQKRSKIKDTIKPDLAVSMKAARIERQRVKKFKPQLLSEKKCKEKKSAVEEIFKDVDANNDIIYTEEYSSSKESLSSNSEEEKSSLYIKNILN